MNLDNYILNWSKENINGVYREILINFSFLGSYATCLLFMILIILFLYVKKDYQRAMIIIAFFITVSFFFEMIKHFFRIPRDTRVFHYQNISSHTIFITSVIFVLVQAVPIESKLRHVLFWFSFFVCILISISRVLTGANFISDVIIGFIFGLVIAYIYYLIEKLCLRVSLLSPLDLPNNSIERDTLGIQNHLHCK